MSQKQLKFKDVFRRIHEELKEGERIEKHLCQPQQQRFSLAIGAPKKIGSRNNDKKTDASQYQKCNSEANFFAGCQKSHKVKKFFDLLQVLNDEIKAHIDGLTKTQSTRVSLEFSKLKGFCTLLKKYNSAEKIEELFQKQEAKIQKIFQHRLSYIFFYLIYAKFFEATCPSHDTRLKALTLCEYYSRDITLFSCTMYVCLELQKAYCSRKFYTTSRHYARKSIKLAVYVGDKNSEFEAMEFMKLLDYYTGIPQIDKTNRLTEEERKVIVEYYNPREDMPSLNFHHEVSDHQNTPAETYLGPNRQNFEFQIPTTQLISKFNQNARQFVSEFSLIKQGMSDHSTNVIQTVERARNIGTVKKYTQDSNYIILQPRSTNILRQNQSQVLLTHQKMEKQKNQNTEAIKVYLKFELPEIEKQLIGAVQGKIFARENRNRSWMGKYLKP